LRPGATLFGDQAEGLHSLLALTLTLGLAPALVPNFAWGWGTWLAPLKIHLHLNMRPCRTRRSHMLCRKTWQKPHTCHNPPSQLDSLIDMNQHPAHPAMQWLLCNILPISAIQLIPRWSKKSRFKGTPPQLPRREYDSPSR
jgi:hypothetical protein